jgi:predicted DCC family thiol-disulfide oxidoreductase YuxK
MIVLYDGDCGLCHRWVQLGLRYPQAGLRFVAQQSPLGQQMLAQQGLLANHGLADGVVVIDGSRAWQGSEAALHFVVRLGGIGRLAALLWLVPPVLRRAGYAWLARHRFGLFGRSTSCVWQPLQSKPLVDLVDVPQEKPGIKSLV